MISSSLNSIIELEFFLSSKISTPNHPASPNQPNNSFIFQNSKISYPLTGFEFLKKSKTVIRIAVKN